MINRILDDIYYDEEIRSLLGKPGEVVGKVIGGAVGSVCGFLGGVWDSIFD